MTGRDWVDELERDDRELSTIRHDALITLIAIADDDLLDRASEMLSGSELFVPAAFELARLRSVMREGRRAAP